MNFWMSIQTTVVNILGKLLMDLCPHHQNSHSWQPYWQFQQKDQVLYRHRAGPFRIVLRSGGMLVLCCSKEVIPYFMKVPFKAKEKHAFTTVGHISVLSTLTIQKSGGRPPILMKV